MNSGQNEIENILNSFRTVCSELERKAEINLQQIKKDCKQECTQVEESLHKFNELISGLAEVCSEVSNGGEVLNLAMKQSVNDNAISMPYEMHSDFVRCLNGLYNNRKQPGNRLEESVINEKHIQLVNDLLKLGEKNVYEVKDIENTLIEAKENLKSAKNMFNEKLTINSSDNT